MNSPDLILTGSYDYRAVALSILIAVLGSYSALGLAERVNVSRGRARLLWLVCGAVAMGIGIWSMHYTAMLAFRLPIPVQYDWPTAVLSLLAGIFASAIAMFAIRRRQIGSPQVVVAGIFMGGCIVGLHYIAMGSMRLQAMCSYSSVLVALSVLVAIIFSLLSLWFTFLFRHESDRWQRKAASALLMGGAISCMHYAGMAAVSFTYSEANPDLSHAVDISFLGSSAIGMVAIMVLEMTVLTSLVDRLAKQTALLDGLFEQAPDAVALMNGIDQVVRVNRAFTRLFGYTPEEAVGRQLAALTVPGEALDEYQNHSDLTKAGQRVDAESVRRRKDGSHLRVSVAQVPVSVPGGQVAVYAIYRDITDRKLAEEKLKTTSEQLRALSQNLRSAREEEGARIARELHDELGAALTRLKWDLEDMSKRCGEEINQEDYPILRERTGEMMALVDEILSNVRRISSELRPGILDDLGLMAAIEWQARQFESRSGIICNVDLLVDDLHLNREQSTAVFRILQEALTNILRHTRAINVNIVVEVVEGELVLEVRDNGRGITEEEIAGSQSLGLIGMRERAHLLGGEIEITGTAGRGTVLTLRVPLHPGPSD